MQNLLGEAVSASVLLAATLKFEGTLTLQLEGKGEVRLLVAQCTNDFRIRAVARMSDDASEPQPITDAEAGERDSAAVAGVFDLGPRAEGADAFASLPKAQTRSQPRRSGNWWEKTGASSSP